DRGELVTRTDLEREARRMMTDARARRLTSFFDQWLAWGSLDALQRDATLFPGLPSNLGAMLHSEARTFVERTVFDLDGRLGSLLTGQYTYVNEALAGHYGLTGVVGSS